MRIVIIGNGVSGVTAARTIRGMISKTIHNRYEVISSFTNEDHLYYPRPRLYEILSGEASSQEIYSYTKHWYDDRNIEVHLNKQAMTIDIVKREIEFTDRSKVEYDKLLLAMGAHPFVPPIEGSEKRGVFTLRTLQDALIIRKYAECSRKTIIIGGGLLGLEAAASLQKLGQQVEVVEIFPRLLPRQLDQDGAEVLKKQIEARGIKIVLGVRTEEIIGKEAISGIVLDNGQKLNGNLVLISAGVRPNLELSMKSGIKVNKGVIVDRFLRTSVDEVYACGNVAEFNEQVFETIPAAIEQGTIVASNLVQQEAQAYSGTVPLNTLKIIGIDLTSLGLVNPESPQYEEVKKIDWQKGIYKKIVLDQKRLVGAIILGDRRIATTIKKFMNREINDNTIREIF